MTPLEYVHTLRLEDAKLSLETTELPVEAIANQAGYEDSSFFSRLFRRKVGLSPTQYRRRFRALRVALDQGGRSPEADVADRLRGRQPADVADRPRGRPSAGVADSRTSRTARDHNESAAFAAPSTGAGATNRE